MDTIQLNKTSILIFRVECEKLFCKSNIKQAKSIKINKKVILLNDDIQ